MLGLDLGTSGVKALLLQLDLGTVLAEAIATYPLSTPHPGWSEQSPADWWRGVTQAIRAVLEGSGVAAGNIVSLALSGQMHGATLLDRQGVVLRPAILWNDQRSGAECDLITERVGLQNLIAWVANPALAGFTAPKLLWVRRHEPEVYDRISTVLLPKDYVNFMLTGEQATEVSDASGTLLFDVVQQRWSQEMLAALDLPASFLPPVHASTEVIGNVTAAAAQQTGLRVGTPVVAGGADNACAAVGMGVVHSGQVLSSLGTSGTVVAPSAEPHLDPAARLHTFCHAVPDTWYLMGVVLSAGGSLRWFRDVLGEPELQHAEAQGVDPYDIILAEAATAPAGSEGLLFLPYLTGERTPHGDPHARGVFFGLSLRHTRAHIARSVVEGITYALADSAAIMRDLGIDITTVRATGGGARSAFWRQLQADILGSPVVTAWSDGGPAFGAAVIAGVGAGALPSVPQAVAQLVTLRDRVEPQVESAAVYRRYHHLFDSLYPALREPYAALAALAAS